MKKLFFSLIMATPILAFSQVMTKSISNCSYWTSQNGYYVCSSYPMSDQMVDAMSLNMKIRDLEKRLAELEKKISSIE